MKKRNVIYVFLALMLSLGLTSCDCNKSKNPTSYNRVFLYYGMGFNNLSENISMDVRDLESGLPDYSKKSKDRVLVFLHLTAKNGDYNTKNSPMLMEVHRNKYNVVVRDTLKFFDNIENAATPEAFSEVLTYVKDNYPSQSYGMVMSSHGTGWLPDGYYKDPLYDNCEDGTIIWNGMEMMQASAPGPSPTGRMPRTYGAATKALGSNYEYIRNSLFNIEMDVMPFVASLPMHFDYIIMDMCLCGCVEIAYQLRHSTDKIVFSPMEIYTEGYQYQTILKHLLPASGGPDLESICKETYNYYMGYLPYVTTTALDCTAMGDLADVCADLISRYSSALASVDPKKITGYFRNNRHFFYDLEDIFLQAGISDADSVRLSNALGKCIICHYASPKGIGAEFPLTHTCGVSMCLPNNTSDWLKIFYADYDWAKDTGLVSSK